MKMFISLFTVLMVMLFFSLAPVCAQPNGAYERALYLYKNGRFDEAVTQLRDYLQRRPEPSAYYLMGYALYKLGRYYEATRYFDEAYLLEPGFRPEAIDFSRAKQ